MEIKYLKNIMIIALLTGFISTGMAYAKPDFSRPLPEEIMQPRPQIQGEQPGMQMPKRPSPEEFERRLNLTEEQKNFAKEQRLQSIEKIKPILDEINSKKTQMEKLSAQNAPSEEITALDNEIKDLRRKAHEIRKENFKAFEATLSESQRKELQIMKKEGRKEFEKTHKMNKIKTN